MTRKSAVIVSDVYCKLHMSNLTMTPKERLSPVDKNVLLSSILKFFFPGNWRMIRSTHIIDAVRKSVQPSMKFFNPGIEAVSRRKMHTSKSTG
jgi:hypothetical protein